MKISKRQLKKIIREEKKNLYDNLDFGSNSERQRNLKESGDIHGGQLEGLANASVAQIESMMDQWGEIVEVQRPDYSQPDGIDPRADDVYDLLFQVRERMMAILENRE